MALAYIFLDSLSSTLYISSALPTQIAKAFVGLTIALAPHASLDFEATNQTSEFSLSSPFIFGKAGSCIFCTC